MKCELDYCIYNRNLFCILKETQLNSMGMCAECILVSVSDDILNDLKERQFKETESRWEDYK